jgi:ribosome-associated toxin RatA of RatAB toxin-antitoxin module
MQQIRRKARVPYTARQMLELVNDIEAYPEFLHWCQAATIESSNADTVEAALEIGIRGIHRTMRTRNRTEVAEQGDSALIWIEMIDGPLRHLSGGWAFDPVAGNGCDIELRLDYEVQRTPFGLLLRTLFDEIANSQLNAFIRRAGVLYGRE